MTWERFAELEALMAAPGDLGPLDDPLGIRQRTDPVASEHAVRQRPPRPPGALTAISELQPAAQALCREVQRLDAEGLTGREIAERLGISATTVSHHRRRPESC